MEHVRGACPHDCPDTCAWTVETRGGAAVGLRGDPEHPFTRGGLCAKVNHFLDRVYSPDRVLTPLRRVGPKGSGRFEPVTWEEALDLAVAGLEGAMTGAGPRAVLPYSYMGTQGIVQGASLDRRFFARLGATRLERAICGSAGGSGLTATLGTSTGILPEDAVHSRLILLWGTNPVVTNLHLWPLLLEARRRGARIVVIDPVRTRTAMAADLHLQPFPGTDAALALGLMHVIVKENRQDSEYLERYTEGFDRLRERLAEYPPERVASITGIDAGELIALAREYASVRPALIRTLVGLEHHANGAMMLRTIACLPAVVGAWRDPGGGLLHMTAHLFIEALDLGAVTRADLEDRSIRSVNMVQLGRALTDPAMDPAIRALVVYNSNPAAIAPNQNRVLAGLARKDLFIIVVEQFLTDTARYADLVFPATTQVEHYDLLWSWGHTYLTLNRPAIAPRGEAAPNTEFFRRLARRMGFTENYLQESDLDLVRAALGTGHPYLAGITLDRLMAEGWAELALPRPWVPFAEGNFPTPSGRCRLYSEDLKDRGMDPLPAHAPPDGVDAGDAGSAKLRPLQLLTPKSAVHFLNSSYSHLPRHRKAEGEPHLDIHSADAGPRGIVEGGLVRVYNAYGEVLARARVGAQVRPGVVSMPSGWWASQHSGGRSANALTPDGLSDLGGGGDFHDARVEVLPVAEETGSLRPAP